MIRSGWALVACWHLAAMLLSSAARAGVWGMDPVLGLVGDYSTNPALLSVPHTAETNGAFLIDVPTTYNSDAFVFSIVPSFRLGNSKGYSSLVSDYEHLSTKAEFDSERGMLTATAGIARDSSLYLNYLTNGSAGVQRDASTADLDWQRLLTERLEFDADISTQHVRYGESSGAPTLVDYQYTSVAPAFSWKTSERNKLTVTASVGRYDSLDGTTESRSANLQAGFTGQLSELWSVTATAGYSRALNEFDTKQPELVFTANGLAIEFLPLKLESSQNGSIYSVNLARHGSRLTLNASASRQLTPTGLAYLSSQKTYEFMSSYALSDRWSLAADARYVNAQNPQLHTAPTDYTIKYLAISSEWRWTEKLTLSVSASRVTERIVSPNFNLASSELTVTLSHRFSHINFQ
jgi:hypothetical protein